MNYTSRSAIEAYQDCPRYRFNQYFYPINKEYKGIVRVNKSVPLVTGTAIHKGVEHCLARVKIGEEPDVDIAVQLAVNQYKDDCEEKGFYGKALESDKQQKFTFEEQKALTEALVRAWFYRELPNIRKRYKVLAVEREVRPIKLIDGLPVFFQAKVDAEFQEIETGDYHNYSLKSVKHFNEKTEESYKSDLQGITEIWSVEEEAKEFGKTVDEIVGGLEKLDEFYTIPQDKLVQIGAYLKKKQVDKKISAVRFCFLVKGVNKQTDYGENPLRITYNPLIRGYKNITPTGVSYAHSWFYPNPNNKSGKSVLGQGWTPFNVWESDIGIKEWMKWLDEERFQSDCGDVIRQYVVTPVEYSRDEREIQDGVEEIKYQEQKVFSAIHQLTAKYTFSSVDTTNIVMKETFPKYRKHCYFHFGDKCEYMDLCWKSEVSSDPIGSGLYQIREPHHMAERVND